MKEWRLLFLLTSVLCSLSFSAEKQGVSESGDLIASAKEFVGLLAKEEFSKAASNFDGTMKRVLPPEKLREVWNSLIGQTGRFQRQLSVRTGKGRQFDIVFVTCQFEKLSLDVKVVFDAAGQITGLWFVPSQPAAEYKPPVYAGPETFREKEVVIGSGEWALPGTLALPVGDGPFPAVVLVHGSGPHDRDESVGPNKPFRDMAWGLASRGIAVLRYEKRTKEYAAKLASMKDGITVREESIEDALAAVSMLRKRDEIDAERIFVLGHSLGGMLIPRIGALDPGIAGCIIMAGTARPLEDVIVEQMSYVFSLDGEISESEKKELEQVKAQAARVKDPDLSATASSSDLLLGAPYEYWLDLRGYNPPEAAKGLKQPILILQGERDYQVTMKDFQLWKKSLSGRENVEFKTYPKLNHLFIEGEGRSVPVEYQLAGNVAKIAIDDIIRWIKER